jgi:flagellar biogenesis protein FliO
MTKRPVTIFCLVVLQTMTFFYPPVFSQEEQPMFAVDSTGQTVPLEFNQADFDPVGTLFKTVGLLIFLSLMLYFGIRIYRNYLQSNQQDTQKHKIRVLSTTPLAPRKSVCIMEALDHVLVVGMADNQMSVLLDVPVDKLNDETRASLLQTKAAPEQRFGHLLNTWMKKQS